MSYFVKKGSIVREIWGNADTILFIFAGAAAEFALNKAVDWLYFTGRLPADPLGRLFSTVDYARRIVFSEDDAALQTIDRMAIIHKGVEEKRGYAIPDWAYRDVLFMLIDYSIRSFEVLERQLTEPEKEEIFEVFNKVGLRMGIAGLPGSFQQWLVMREQHLQEHLEYSHYTKDLFKQYRAHLGPIRYKLLTEAQVLVTPKLVREQLSYQQTAVISVLLGLYKIIRNFSAGQLLKDLILPTAYKTQIKSLDFAPKQ